MTSAANDPSTVPEWARESIARIAREQPETFAHWLAHVAEVEDAKQRMPDPTPPPPPPDNACDYLHLAAIKAWQAITYPRPAPDMDPSILFQEMLDVFGTGSAISPVEKLIDDWYELARKCGITVTGEDDELRPDIDEAVTRTVTASIWFGITTGYLTLTGSYGIPNRLKMHL